MTTTLTDARLTFGGALRAEFRKLTTVRGMWWVALSSIVLSGFMMATSSRAVPEGGADASWTATSITGAVTLPWVITGIFAALQATGEWTTGQFRVSFATVPRRDLWLATKACALAIYSGVVAILVLAVAAVLVLVRHGGDGATIDLAVGHTWQVLAGGPAVFMATAVMAVGIGALVRASGVAVTAVVALLVLLPFGSLFGLDWLSHITSYLPTGAADSVVGSGAFGPSTDDLGVLLGSAVLVGWAAVAMLAASVSMKRRDA